MNYNLRRGESYLVARKSLCMIPCVAMAVLREMLNNTDREYEEKGASSWEEFHNGSMIDCYTAYVEDMNHSIDEKEEGLVVDYRS